MSPSCIDQPLNGVIDVLAAGGGLYNGFFNPQATVLDNIKLAGYGRIDAVDALLANPLYIGDPDMTALKAQLVELVGPRNGVGYVDSKVGQMLSYTNFLTGRSETWPASLAPYTAGLAGAELVGGLTFFGILGIAQSGFVIDNTLCSITNPPDPDDPCKGINKIFDSIFGAFNAVLTAMMNGINAMTDIINLAASYVNQAINFVAQLVNKLTAAIGELVRQMIEALRYGLAKLLQALFNDPCMNAVIQAAGEAALITALENSNV